MKVIHDSLDNRSKNIETKKLVSHDNNSLIEKNQCSVLYGEILR